MKKLIIVTIFSILAIFGPAADAHAIQDQCSPKAKDTLYQSFLKNRQNDEAKAYEDAKKYMLCPVTETTEAQQKVINYLKKWSTRYKEAKRWIRLTDPLYKDGNYPEAFRRGAEILEKEPDSLRVLVDLGAIGYVVANNQALAAQALGYGRRALQQLESGNTLDDWHPFGNRDTAMAYLNFNVGVLIKNTDPSNALKHFMKAVQVETPLKKSPLTYAFIAAAYETGGYAKQQAQYKTGIETPESKLALAHINQLIDRMIDAYARAVALAENDPIAFPKSTWMEDLTTWYKYRNKGSDAGLAQMIQNILSRPLPPLPTPLTSPPQ